MRKFIFIVLLCITIAPSLLCENFYTGTETVSLINTVESNNSFISYVLINGRTFIIKQKKNAAGQFSVVRDAFAAYIAKDFSIAHSVEIISSKKKIPGKVHAKYPGALLTIAPGATIRSQKNSKYYNLCLKQRTVNGELAPNRWLTEQIIYQITWHKQLPIIIGLDLFICNTDRHGGIFFMIQRQIVFVRLIWIIFLDGICQHLPVKN